VKTTLVVPCYNEAARLPVAAFEAFSAARPEVRLLFVDDGSADGTASLLTGLAARLGGRAEVLSLARNAGKAEAVRRGMCRAFESGAEAAGYWDADLSAPLEALPEFVAALEGDPSLLAVFGSRVKRLGARVERSAARHLLGRVFATAASLLAGVPAYDTQCGAKLFRAGPEARGIFGEPFLSRWAFDVEILARMRRAGLDPASRVLELPLRVWRHAGGSKLSWTGAAGAALDLLRIRARFDSSVGKR
jgi:dolichyl-phosphate beta-glucosyltransferase